mmetsp:Transcript_70422/g.138282  ORF Transcript_70422/g.138282 Transcript_70422/m.138282 type:complete len:447 (-) Transcript_70422:378-1718(-)
MVVAPYCALALLCTASAVRTQVPTRDARSPVGEQDGRPSVLLEASSEEGWGGASRLALSALAGGRPAAWPPAVWSSPPTRAAPLRMIPEDMPPPPPPPPPQEIVVPAPATATPRSFQAETVTDQVVKAMAQGSSAEVAPGQEGVAPAPPPPDFDFKRINEEALQLLKEGRSVEVAPMAVREVNMMDRVRGFPNVQNYIDQEVVGDEVSVLEDAVESTDLARRFEELQQTRNLKLPFMPLEESLPLLADILRGTQSLGAGGVIHLDLACGRAITLVPDAANPGAKRAIVAELGKSACVASDDGGALSCKFLTNRRVGKVGRQAPEELALTNNMWQVGLLFSKMCLGVFPPEEQLVGIFKKEQLDLNKYDTVPAGRDLIRAAISDEFDLGKSIRYQAFKLTNPDAARLIEGMLEKNPAKRWSPERALEETQKVMMKRGLEVPGPLMPK